MRIHIDRDLPVSIALQLQGQIEYGVTCGDFAPGSQLPSVRELADQLGVSPVTISNVYKTLQRKELIVTHPGKGTFVQTADKLEHTALHHHAGHLDTLIERLSREASSLGLEPASLTQLLQTRLSQRSSDTPLQIYLIGVYAHATRDYAAALAKRFSVSDRVASATFREIYESDSLAAKLREADLVLTFAHRLKELRDHLGEGVRVKSINLIPSMRTRVALAELDPLDRVGLISTVPEFLPTFTKAVRRFAPHVEFLDGALLGTPESAALARTSDIVVYATGSESIAETLPRHVKSFEYRHEPDPIHLRHAILPALEDIRRDMPLHEPLHETPTP